MKRTMQKKAFEDREWIRATFTLNDDSRVVRRNELDSEEELREVFRRARTTRQHRIAQVLITLGLVAILTWLLFFITRGL